MRHVARVSRTETWTLVWQARYSGSGEFDDDRRQPRPQVVGSRGGQIEQRRGIERDSRRATPASRRTARRRTSAAASYLTQRTSSVDSPASSAARAIASSMKPILSTRPRSSACLAVKIWPVATASSAAGSSLNFGRPLTTISLKPVKLSSTSRFAALCALPRSSAWSGCPSA